MATSIEASKCRTIKSALASFRKDIDPADPWQLRKRAGWRKETGGCWPPVGHFNSSGTFTFLVFFGPGRHAEPRRWWLEVVPQLPEAAPDAAAVLPRREEAELSRGVAVLPRRGEAELSRGVAVLQLREAELRSVAAALPRHEEEPLGAAQWLAAGLLLAGSLVRVAAYRWGHVRQAFGHSSAAPPRPAADCARAHRPAARRRPDAAGPEPARSPAAVHSAK
jgi:hypothetical protein